MARSRMSKWSDSGCEFFVSVEILASWLPSMILDDSLMPEYQLYTDCWNTINVSTTSTYKMPCNIDLNSVMVLIQRQQAIQVAIKACTC